jgi:3-oxoacid CoA-transferase A subunit
MSPARVFPSAADAVADVPNGAVVMVAGYARPGTPQSLVRALLDKGVEDLTCICGPWYGRDPDLYDAAKLVARGRVKKLITSPPIHNDQGSALPADVEVELVAQGALAERVRAGGAGLGGVLLPAAGPASAREGVESRTVDGVRYVLATPLRADFSLLRARRADTLGNLVYRGSQRNWNPVMAMAARVTIVEVEELVQPGELDPELVITPGIYVSRIVHVGAG